MHDLLSTLPAEWDRRRLKFTSHIDTSGVWGDDEGENECDLPTVTTANIDRLGRFDLIDATVRSFNKEEAEYYRCRPGDIVVVKSSGSATSIITGKCAQASAEDQDFCFGNFTLRVRANADTVCDRFLFYFLVSGITVERIKIMVSITTYPNLKVGEYIGHEIPLPPLNTQQRIAQFLDEKTAQIDGLIEKKRALLERLAEKRQALITRAVTKGLNPDAPMKSSGIDWLGDIPAHWTVKELRRVRKYMTSGSRDWAAYYSDEGDPFLRMTNVTSWGVELDLSDLQFVRLEGVTEGTRTSVRNGDILITITAELGAVAIVRKHAEGAYINQHLALFRPDPAHCASDFLVSFLSTDMARAQFAVSGQGGTKQGLGFEQVNNVLVGFPPLSEQETIGDYCNSLWRTFKTAEESLTQSIDRLREYRSSLITAAVTGQIGGLNGN